MKKTFFYPRNKSFFRKGFTMIEMLVVITIIAVVTSIGLISYRSSVISARNAKRKKDLEAVKQALLLYRIDNGNYPTAFLDSSMSVVDAGAQSSQPQSKFTLVSQAYAVIDPGNDLPQDPGDLPQYQFTPTNTPAPVVPPDQFVPTNTPVPVGDLHKYQAEPTNTPAPVLTNTPVPVATNTPVPVATSTPVPEPTASPGVNEEDVVRFNAVTSTLSTDGYLDIAVIDPKNKANYRYTYVTTGNAFTLCCNLEPDVEQHCVHNP